MSYHTMSSLLCMDTAPVYPHDKILSVHTIRVASSAALIFKTHKTTLKRPPEIRDFKLSFQEKGSFLLFWNYVSLWTESMELIMMIFEHLPPKH